MTPSILIVEDEEALTEMLRACGHICGPAQAA